MTIELTPDLERALAQVAHERGTTPESLAMEYLRDGLMRAQLPDPTTTGARNLEESLEGYIGVLSSSEYVPGGANMSSMTGRDIGEDLLKRREEGRL